MTPDIDRNKPYQAFPYTIDRLAEIFSAASKTSEHLVRQKQQFDYFESYFGHLEEKGPLTIVAEWKYTDRDFLEDYGAYYVRCFQEKYSSVCARLHFFRAEFDEAELQAAVTGSAPELLADLMDRKENRYLGFVVVKPLPLTFIGRTCLRIYEDGEPLRRFYPVARECDAHLLGLNLTIKSLPFQEQDTIAAACATSALWSALQSTAYLFQHEIRSPVEITKIATEHAPSRQRDVPSRGLTALQMAVAVKKAGLEPELIAPVDAAALQATVYGYLRAKIPLVMMTALYDVSKPDHPKPLEGDWESRHAVTVTGFSLGGEEPVPYPGTATLLKSSRIDKLYVHDDQIGPFARLEFGTPPLLVSHAGKSKQVSLTLSSYWRGEAGEPGTVWFGPKSLIVPLYHKIRIRFDTILGWVLKRDEWYRESSDPAVTLTEPEWEIYLTTGSELKSDVQSATKLDPDQRWKWLKRPLPRFLWRATAFAGDSRAVDFLFDATDIDQGDFLLGRIKYQIE